MNERDYVNEKSMRFELTALNLKEKYKKEEQDQEKIKSLFEKRVQDRLLEVQEELKTLETKNSVEEAYKNFLEAEIPYLKELTIEKQNKSRAGMMILLIIKNLAKKPCFAGYTNNWKDEFYSKAIENCLKYIHNFNEDKISERTGKKIKAFAYITQIAYMSFISVINEKKKEDNKINSFKSLEEHFSTVKSESKNSSKFNFEYEVGIETDLVQELTNITQKIQEFKEVKDQKTTIDLDIFSYTNSSESLESDYFLDLLNQKEKNVERFEEIKKELKVDYVPQTIILHYIKDSDVKKIDLHNICEKANIYLILEPHDEKEFSKLKHLNKKITKETK